MAEVALVAQNRPAQGSAHTRRLRKEGRIPAVLYGHGIEPVALSVNARELRSALNTPAGVNALIQLNIEGTKHLALTRDVQRHPVRGTVAHLDFLVVSRNEAITAEIPITFTGEALKVTKMGGIVEHQLTSLSVTATASTLPSHLELDISELELEGALRVHHIPLPKGVTSNIDSEETVVVGRVSRAAASDEAAEPEEGETAAATPAPDES